MSNQTSSSSTSLVGIPLSLLLLAPVVQADVASWSPLDHYTYPDMGESIVRYLDNSTVTKVGEESQALLRYAAITEFATKLIARSEDLPEDFARVVDQDLLDLL